MLAPLLVVINLWVNLQNYSNKLMKVCAQSGKLNRIDWNNSLKNQIVLIGSLTEKTQTTRHWKELPPLISATRSTIKKRLWLRLSSSIFPVSRSSTKILKKRRLSIPIFQAFSPLKRFLYTRYCLIDLSKIDQISNLSYCSLMEMAFCTLGISDALLMSASNLMYQASELERLSFILMASRRKQWRLCRNKI